MKSKSVKTGLICGSAIVALTFGGVIVANAQLYTSTTSATTTDVETGPTAAGVYKATFMVTAPKTVSVPVGATAAQVKTAIVAVAQYVNTKMLTASATSAAEYTQADVTKAENGATALEILGPSNAHHATDIISVSNVDTSKVGTYTATVTAAGTEANTKDATVTVTVNVGETPIYEIAKGNDHYLTTDATRLFALQMQGYNSLHVIGYAPTSGTLVNNWYSNKLQRHVFTTNTSAAYVAHLKALGYTQFPSTVYSAASTAVPVSVSYNAKANHFYTTSKTLPTGYGNATTAFYASSFTETVPSTSEMVTLANSKINAYITSSGNTGYTNFLNLSPVQSVTCDSTTGAAVVTVAVKAAETKALALGYTQAQINSLIAQAEAVGTEGLLTEGVKSVSYNLV